MLNEDEFNVLRNLAKGDEYQRVLLKLIDIVEQSQSKTVELEDRLARLEPEDPMYY